MASVSWKKNLYVMFAAEFIVIMGFSFIMPFMPLFVQQLGNFNSERGGFLVGDCHRGQQHRPVPERSGMGHCFRQGG